MRNRSQPPCDLDPLEYNLASAWYQRPLPEGHPCAHVYEPGWKAMHHGCGPVDVMRKCGCLVCQVRAEQLTTPRMPPPPAEPEPPKRVDVTEVRAHVRSLLASGMSTDELALAAGVDRSTVYRVLRPYAAQVSVSTAVAVLAVSA